MVMTVTLFQLEFLLTSRSKVVTKGEKKHTMTMENTKNTPEEVVIGTKFCERKKSKEAGFMVNAKEYMDLFVHASFDQHKACFMASWDKMVARIQGGKPAAAMEGGDTTSKK